MDIGELLAFKASIWNAMIVKHPNYIINGYPQPEQTPKRPHEDDDDFALPEPASSDIGKRGGGDEKSKRMRRIADAKETANYRKSHDGDPMGSGSINASSFEFDPELTEEERLNILKYVESEEAEGEGDLINNRINSIRNISIQIRIQINIKVNITHSSFINDPNAVNCHVTMSGM